MLSYLFQDWDSNKGNLKGRLVLFSFRLAQAIGKYFIIKVLFCWYLALYHVWVEWFLGIEIPRKLQTGKGLILYHGQALVINQAAVIGNNCTLRNSTTIGHKLLPDGSLSKCPRIGNNVDIGANVCIIGDINIGDNVKIGAGAVFVKDVPPNAIVAGNPAKVISTSETKS
jgi:putative colanic acid biosynthesis acetyltransferase WcaB